MNLKGMTEPTLMTLFYVLLALGAVGAFFLLAQFVFAHQAGVRIG